VNEQENSFMNDDLINIKKNNYKFIFFFL